MLIVIGKGKCRVIHVRERLAGYLLPEKTPWLGFICCPQDRNSDLSHNDSEPQVFHLVSMEDPQKLIYKASQLIYNEK